MTTGQCICGELRYEFTGEPVMKVRQDSLLSFPSILIAQAICHCLTCRHLSGSAFTTNVAVPEGNFDFTSGTPKTYATRQDSGMTLTYSFCGNCGCTVSKVADAEAFKGIVLIQAGSLDDVKGIEGAEPGAELYVSRRVGWLNELEGKGQMWEFT
jgi:hypothetical protein